VGPQGRVEACNAAMRTVLGRDPAETIGKPLWEALRQRPLAGLVEKTLASGGDETVELPAVTAGDPLWQVQARALGESPRRALLIFRDISNVRRLETMRKDFVANVSHELKTPLTALRASLETLLEGALEDPAHAREFLETAHHNVQRLQRLIDDLLTLARLDRSQSAPSQGAACFPAVAGKVLATLKPVAEKAGVSLKADWPDREMWLELSEDELTQVLMNLVDNAIKFNRPGGSVTVKAAAGGFRGEIWVSDTGIGVPAEDRPRVFERFYRVDKARSREREGTGLGLAIVKHVVENRSGKVSLESAPGGGSVFKVVLPLHS
jgi:two-component system, OmpR family, phosphate regulon sensor histidine kinase PhoR